MSDKKSMTDDLKTLHLKSQIIRSTEIIYTRHFLIQTATDFIRMRRCKKIRIHLSLITLIHPTTHILRDNDPFWSICGEQAVDFLRI